MIPLSLADIAAVTGGTVSGDPALVVTGPAYLDSRLAQPGGLFVAVAGDRVDGHSFAAHAYAVLGSRPTGRPTVVVPDPVAALGRLARHVVRAVAPTVLAVTGSHGKTTTKDYLAALLPGAVATEGNRNNELGVPLTALRLRPDSDLLVLEMGARGVGHLSYLCDIAPPRVAVVLGVGSAHVGAFGSLDLTATAKGELPAALPGDGVAVLNADDPRVAAMPTPARVLTFGERGDVTWRGLHLDRLARPTFSLGHAGIWHRVRLHQSGAYQVANACAAAAAALAVGVPLDTIAQRLSTVEEVSPLRMAVSHHADGLIVLDDTYNANPEAMRAALRTLVSIGSGRAGRTIAVLGPMRELGEASASAHAGIGSHARALGVDVVLSVGATAYASGIGFSDIPSAVHWLREHLGPEDTVLVKGSRAAGLDALSRDLRLHLSSPTPATDKSA
ncbi:UDP-N-acetylmuramoyl-tripeptide--D-alanyl-D-alanine ligase [Hamadaea tsunoensis]|uniref:UDP-N-acetylmuramoyl-tripeptide--D-alanyl-D- alanine ligase n=1 Tax=Hamadaea tsunoensis TaxID=53368 RepID=UPI000403181C|nr:UDP-N-acetylmuramoyl-tripeptide--D-alanyl-D-alanine ligase [Hamadaea tsunoensis]